MARCRAAGPGDTRPSATGWSSPFRGRAPLCAVLLGSAAMSTLRTMGEAEEAVRRRMEQQRADATAELYRKRAAIPGLVTDVLTLLKNADFADGEFITISQMERRSDFSRPRLVEREIVGWQIAEYSVEISGPYKGSEIRWAKIWLLSDGRFAGDFGNWKRVPFVGLGDNRTVERLYKGLIKLVTTIEQIASAQKE